MRETHKSSSQSAFVSGTSPCRAVHFKRRGASLGLAIGNTSAWIQEIEKGFSFKTLLTFESNSGLTLPLLASLIGIPERTLARRKTAGKLAPEESERLLRISTIFEKCVELFEGDVAAAVNWLTSPQKAFSGHTALLYSRTELGAREVENLIGRLEHGVFS